MIPRNALDWSPPDGWRRIVAIESHTGGEPFRVIIDGMPDIPGDTVLERRRYAQDNLDHIRRALVWEPRGHADMYGCFLGPPTNPGSDIAVLFIHNEGFSTMCGHGIIALTKVALETGILPVDGPETTIGIDTPAGQIIATASVEEDSVKEVGFQNVPSFVLELDAEVDVPGMGTVRYDLAFGGAFYAYVDAASVGLRCSPEHFTAIVEEGRLIKHAIAESKTIEHPFEPDLGFLYGVIFTGPAESPDNHSRHVCVFADGEVDRSPTGTGVSGRLAIHHTRGEVAIGDLLTIESILGSTFTGSIAKTVPFGPYEAVVPEISGFAHISGKSEFWIDSSDTIGQGFLLR
jgi:trans-L-3-hydroxyproline dehydratase